MLRCIAPACLVPVLFCGCSNESPTVVAPAASEANTVESTAPDAATAEAQGYALPGLDHGLCQSPINIMTSKVEADGGHKVAFNYQKSSEEIKNLGHTIEVEYDAGNTATFDGRTFEFKQFHFHTPSEHLIDGVTYPLEMHMVHTLEDASPDAEPTYLVVGILFKEGAENPFLASFMNAIPETSGETAKVEGGTVDINELFSQTDSLAYFHYEGSLTTPPFSETVTWLVLQHVFEASPEQVEKFNKAGRQQCSACAGVVWPTG